MESIKELFRVGYGPSSSHTMGPSQAAIKFREKYPEAKAITTTLYGSLALTGKGHMTDVAINKIFHPVPVTFIWDKEKYLDFHPNGITFTAFTKDGAVLGEETAYSIGGGAISYGDNRQETPSIYPHNNMNDILEYCQKRGLRLWEYVFKNEPETIYDHLRKVWKVMMKSVKRGIENEGVLTGGLGLARRAHSYYRQSQIIGRSNSHSLRLFAYAFAVSEENASGHIVCTAPTCGSSGVLPAILYFLREEFNLSENEIIRALATAGLIGNLVKENASISGAEVGCQGEIGTACSMAAGAACQLMGGTIKQIEYAAEIGLEHNLGLTCDPIKGLVQIPCIERNAMSVRKAYSAASMASFSDGTHFITFDEVVKTMKETGNDLPHLYKETSTGGLAKEFEKRMCKKTL